MILTADLHLDDKPENEYRWKIFTHLEKHSDGIIYILGDLCDRADRHSASLVNRLIAYLNELALKNDVTILLGNHDKPLKGLPYFSFLNFMDRVKFIIYPCVEDGIMLLPYSHNPTEDWKGWNLDSAKCIFMHQTITGADTGTRILENPLMPPLPKHLPIYSGDIHTCQTIDNFVYVGAPYPVKFGDAYKCRLLRLDDEFRMEEILLPSTNKRVIEVNSLEQLQNIAMNDGDQARIRFTIPANEMDQWPSEQEAIAKWAQKQGVTLASVEAIIETSPETIQQTFDFDADPERVLKAFCLTEGVEDSIYQTGLNLLKNHRS
jgi:calcineurin-like phosphoesterase family protein